MPSIKISLPAQSWHEICNNWDTGQDRGRDHQTGFPRQWNNLKCCEEGEGWECQIVIKLKCSLNCKSLLGDKDWSISASSQAVFDWLEGPGPGLGLTRGWQCRPHSVAPQINLGSPACCGISMEIWPKHCRVETWRVAGVEWTGVTALESADPAFTENTPSSVGPLWWWARVSWSLQSSPHLRHDRTVRRSPGLNRSDFRLQTSDTPR